MGLFLLSVISHKMTEVLLAQFIAKAKFNIRE